MGGYTKQSKWTSKFFIKDEKVNILIKGNIIIINIYAPNNRAPKYME